VWKDNVTGEVAFQLEGDTDVLAVTGTTVAFMSKGVLSELATYRAVKRAWLVITARFGLTIEQTSAALARGEAVPRPTLMNIPRPDWLNGSYARVIDFGADVGLSAEPFAFRYPHRVVGWVVSRSRGCRWIASEDRGGLLTPGP